MADTKAGWTPGGGSLSFGRAWLTTVGVAGIVIGSTFASNEADKAAVNEAAVAPVAAGSVSGAVRYGAGTPLRDIVVYLEPTDHGVTFPAPESPAILKQQGAQFYPSLLPISLGQVVEFHNNESDPIEHNVFSRSPSREFDIGLNAPGVVRSQTFDQCGEVMTYCSIHRLMEGVIYVCPTPFHAAVGVTASDLPEAERTGGAFLIDGVPPGEYVLRTWQKRKRAPDAAIPVTIRAGESTTVDVELRR